MKTVALAIIWLFLLVALNSGIFGTLEAQWYPVISNVSASYTESDLENHSFVFLNFNKLRNCSYHSVTFYIAENGVRSTLRSVLYDIGHIRLLGEHTAGPWDVNTLDRENLEVEIVHVCHWLWPTISTFKL